MIAFWKRSEKDEKGDKEDDEVTEDEHTAELAREATKKARTATVELDRALCGLEEAATS